MSETIEVEQETEAPERGFLHRTFAADLAVGDGRTVDVRIVPYGERITHADGFGGVAKGVPYTEEWAPGAFSHQLKAANRVLANFEHQEGVAGVVGHGLTLRESQDGFYGSFRIHETPAGDTALTLIREKVLAGVSMEALPRKAVKTAAGVVRRVKADLFAVAFTRFPAYTGAAVLAVREEAEIVLDEELLPISVDPGLLARCRALGIELPQRYQAHPDPTDTPAEAGTPDGGTRPPDVNQETKE